MEHWNAALKILVYVASTLDVEVLYRRNPSAKLVGVTDTNFAAIRTSAGQRAATTI